MNRECPLAQIPEGPASRICLHIDGAVIKSAARGDPTDDQIETQLLIEMRYQQHLAQQGLQELFDEAFCLTCVQHVVKQSDILLMHESKWTNDRKSPVNIAPEMLPARRIESRSRGRTHLERRLSGRCYVANAAEEIEVVKTLDTVVVTLGAWMGL